MRVRLSPNSLKLIQPPAGRKAWNSQRSGSPTRANDLEFEHKGGEERSDLGTCISTRRRVTPPHFGNLQLSAEVDLTAARKGSSNSETSYPANAGYGSCRSVSYSRPIFMTSRDFEFGKAIWDHRFSESMESLLSPVPGLATGLQLCCDLPQDMSAA